MPHYCKFDGCLNTNGKRKRASYNFEGLTPKYCSKHKDINMINVGSKLCKCGKRPSFNVPENNIPEYCKICRLECLKESVTILDRK
jgi:hypothetical protein